LSDDLRALEISEKDYAYGVMVLLKSWARSKKLLNVPINTFCGDWALERYVKIHNQEYVRTKDPMTKEQLLLQGELLIGRYTIAAIYQKQFVSFVEIVREIKAMLTDEWLYAYKIHAPRPIEEALVILGEEYGVKNPTSYEDIAGRTRFWQ
jgi:hypothetical protein